MPRRKKEHRSLGGFQHLDEIGDSLSANHVYSSPRMQKRRSLSIRAREAGAEHPRIQDDEIARAQSRRVGTPLQGGGAAYAELHCHSNYSFKEGASYTSELLVRAKELGLAALAITDHDGMSGVMEFAQAAKSVGIKAIIGVEITLTSGHHLTLLAENAAGYGNICRLVTRAHMDPEERNQPALDPALLPEHSAGVICLSGCRRGEISDLVLRGELNEARRVAAQYRDWFGADNFFLELQQNLVQGDAERNRLMAGIGLDLGIAIVATNNVHYHARERSHLNDVLVAIQHNRSLEETHRERRPNDQFYLKSPDEMAALFPACPEAVRNTARIAERCDFELTTARVYDFPDYDVPEGHTQIGWLRKLCEDAAVRRYGSVTPAVRERLDEEMRLLEKHNLAGFVLQYYDIIKTAREVQEDLGLVEPGLPLEENPPGRGRGSSVAMLVGYLIGLSHIDPLKFGLKLDRFLPDDEMSGPPDIDLDFPRDIREELILRVHERWGYERAVLTGMISTYRIKGAIRDVGMALGLPQEDLDKLCKRVDGHAGVRGLPSEMRALPEYRDRVDLPIWQDLVRLSLELGGFPKYLAQHPGGMILSARPLSEIVPLQRSAIDGRYICQWDKDSAEDAGFVKIDFLALGALSQMNEALRLITGRTEEKIDLSRIDFEDRDVYAMLHRADTVGVFQVESAAQMQTITRIRPKNLTEMAWEVGAVRPGVGVNDGVAMLIRRHTGREPEWEYDHPLEAPALERTLGVVLYQDQLMELGMHVAGFSAAEADQMRRAFSRRNRDELVPMWKERFLEGALARGVPEEAALKIFKKFHGEFQFPESHAFAFGVTAYQMSWLKHYYPLEFYVGLFNQQPMGFYNLETLKEDARRHGVQVVNPDVNRSDALSVIDNERLRLGFTHVANVRGATADVILAAREKHGPFASVSDFMARTGVLQEQLDNLADAGAFDSLTSRGVAVTAPLMPVAGAVVAGPVPLARGGGGGGNSSPVPSRGAGDSVSVGAQHAAPSVSAPTHHGHSRAGGNPDSPRQPRTTTAHVVGADCIRPHPQANHAGAQHAAPPSAGDGMAQDATHLLTSSLPGRRDRGTPRTDTDSATATATAANSDSDTAILRLSKDGSGGAGVPTRRGAPTTGQGDRTVAESRTLWQPADDRRRDTKWEVGLRYRPVGRQLAFDMPVEQDMVALPEPSEWEVMTGEYRTMGLHPRGHVMAKLRPHLPRGVIRSVDIADYPEGASIRVAGVVIRRQRPLAKAVFITLEDEFGHSPLVIWPQVYRKLRQVARAPILLARGKVSHRDGTLNVVVTGLQPLDAAVPLSKSKDWG